MHLFCAEWHSFCSFKHLKQTLESPNTARRSGCKGCKENQKDECLNTFLQTWKVLPRVLSEKLQPAVWGESSFILRNVIMAVCCVLFKSSWANKGNLHFGFLDFCSLSGGFCHCTNSLFFHRLFTQPLKQSGGGEREESTVELTNYVLITLLAVVIWLKI